MATRIPCPSLANADAKDGGSNGEDDGPSETSGAVCFQRKARLTGSEAQVRGSGSGGGWAAHK